MQPARTPLAHVDDIPDNDARGFTVAETAIIAVKTDNTLKLFINRCPHLGVPLEWMPDQFLDRDGHYLQCATHGALFRKDNGLCISGPCRGQQLEPVQFALEEKYIMIDPTHLPRTR